MIIHPIVSRVLSKREISWLWLFNLAIVVVFAVCSVNMPISLLQVFFTLEIVNSSLVILIVIVLSSGWESSWSSETSGSTESARPTEA